MSPNVICFLFGREIFCATPSKEVEETFFNIISWLYPVGDIFWDLYAIREPVRPNFRNLSRMGRAAHAQR